LLAEEAPPEPEKVQVVALSSRLGAAVGAGAGAAATSEDRAPKKRKADSLAIVMKTEEQVER
jgi:hypothetical protein